MYELAVTAVINAPRAHVWQVMTDRLAEWWCPKPWTTEIEQLDRHPGGASVLVMRGPNKEMHRTAGLVLAWEEGRRFSFTDAITPDLTPADLYMIGIWSIAQEGEATRYTAVSRHWTQEAMEEHQRMGFEDGWNTVAAQLKALCEETV